MYIHIYLTIYSIPIYIDMIYEIRMSYDNHSMIAWILVVDIYLYIYINKVNLLCNCIRQWNDLFITFSNTLSPFFINSIQKHAMFGNSVAKLYIKYHEVIVELLYKLFIISSSHSLLFNIYRTNVAFLCITWIHYWQNEKSEKLQFYVHYFIIFQNVCISANIFLSAFVCTIAV